MTCKWRLSALLCFLKTHSHQKVSNGGDDDDDDDDDVDDDDDDDNDDGDDDDERIDLLIWYILRVH